MLRVFDVKRKSPTKCWNKLVKGLTEAQRKLFSKEKYWFTFCKIFNWRENTAKLRNTRPYRVLSRLDMIMMCVVKPKNVNMLSSIWSKAKENDICVKESLVHTINDERMYHVTLSDDEDVVVVPKSIEANKEDDKVASTAICESREVEMPSTACNAGNDSGYLEVEEEKGISIEKLQENSTVNPYDKIYDVKLVSDEDLVNNFSVMLKSKMPKPILNKLRRRRQNIRHRLINQDRARRGVAAIKFKERKRLRK